MKKWEMNNIPIDTLLNKVLLLEERVKKLEEENVETSNTLYELMNSIEAVDDRIDIVANNFSKNNV
jgi:hypothetical protein